MRPHAPLLVCWIAALSCLPGCPRKQARKAAPDAPRPDATPPGPPLEVSAFSFAGPAGHRPDGKFRRGETVSCLFTVAGFTYKEGKAHIVADLHVHGPGGALLLRRPEMVLLDGPAPTLTPGAIRSAATLRLSPAAPPGKHRVEITVRDLLGRRSGSGTASYTLIGSPHEPSETLTLARLEGAADIKLPPGAALPVALEVRGFKTRKDEGGMYGIDLGVTATVEDLSGQPLGSHGETLVKTTLPFAPAAYPAEYISILPSDLAPGPYRLAIAVKDRVGGGETKGLLRFQVVPRSLGVFNLHVHDNASLPRQSFLPGEQVYVRLAVVGLTTNAEGEVDGAVDLAIAGPDGGVYLARKAAATVAGPASKQVARIGRFPVQLPLVLPTLCPTGKYRVVIRARDGVARREVVREHRFSIEGKAPPRLTDFKVDQLQVQERPDLPPSKGDTFVAGHAYHLTLRLGGAKLESSKKMSFTARIKADLRLKNLRGEVVHELKGLFEYGRTLTYRPLRLLIPARWKVPSRLPPGLYDLEIVALDQLDERVSQMIRRVEIVRRRPLP